MRGVVQCDTERYSMIQYDGEYDRDQDSEIIPCVEEDKVCVYVLMERELHGGECQKFQIQYGTEQYDTEWYSIVQNVTERYSMVQNGTVWYRIIPLQNLSL